MTMVMGRVRFGVMLAASMIMAVPAAALAQVQSVDPDQAIDGDLPGGPRGAQPPAPVERRDPPADPPPTRSSSIEDTPAANPPSPSPAQARAAAAVEGGRETYRQDDLIGAAEGVFGKGAKGLAETIQGILRKQGEPDGYIVGREGGGAFIAGVRYGSGTLFHRIEGEQPVYWTGPSIGFDAGANVGSTFALVYNLHDTEDLYRRFVAGEGQAYLIGGFNISYLRHGDVVLIPIRLGAGLRLGANIGYMRFSHTQRWLPF